MKRSMDPRGPPLADRGTLEETPKLLFLEHTLGRGKHGLPSSFLFGADHALSSAGPAIAMARLEPLELLQQGDRGARPVADDEWCVAMSAGSSRVFRWRARCRWRGRWGSEWPGWWCPVLRPLTVLALPIPQSPVLPQSQAVKASFGAKRLHSLSTSLIRGFLVSISAEI
jgi:hypothetical protein